jgi:hypothetical protein
LWKEEKRHFLRQRTPNRNFKLLRKTIGETLFAFKNRLSWKDGKVSHIDGFSIIELSNFIKVKRSTPWWQFWKPLWWFFTVPSHQEYLLCLVCAYYLISFFDENAPLYNKKIFNQNKEDVLYVYHFEKLSVKGNKMFNVNSMTALSDVYFILQDYLKRWMEVTSKHIGATVVEADVSFTSQENFILSTQEMEEVKNKSDAFQKSEEKFNLKVEELKKQHLIKILGLIEDNSNLSTIRDYLNKEKEILTEPYNECVENLKEYMKFKEEKHIDSKHFKENTEDMEKEIKKKFESGLEMINNSLVLLNKVEKEARIICEDPVKHAKTFFQRENFENFSAHKLEISTEDVENKLSFSIYSKSEKQANESNIFHDFDGKEEKEKSEFEVASEITENELLLTSDENQKNVSVEKDKIIQGKTPNGIFDEFFKTFDEDLKTIVNTFLEGKEILPDEPSLSKKLQAKVSKIFKDVPEEQFEEAKEDLFKKIGKKRLAFSFEWHPDRRKLEKSEVIFTFLYNVCTSLLGFIELLTFKSRNGVLNHKETPSTFSDEFYEKFNDELNQFWNGREEWVKKRDKQIEENIKSINETSERFEKTIIERQEERKKQREESEKQREEFEKQREEFEKLYEEANKLYKETKKSCEEAEKLCKESSKERKDNLKKPALLEQSNGVADDPPESIPTIQANSSQEESPSDDTLKKIINKEFDTVQKVDLLQKNKLVDYNFSSASQAFFNYQEVMTDKDQEGFSCGLGYDH